MNRDKRTNYVSHRDAGLRCGGATREAVLGALCLRRRDSAKQSQICSVSEWARLAGAGARLETIVRNKPNLPGVANRGKSRYEPGGSRGGPSLQYSIIPAFQPDADLRNRANERLETVGNRAKQTQKAVVGSPYSVAGGTTKHANKPNSPGGPGGTSALQEEGYGKSGPAAASTKQSQFPRRRWNLRTAYSIPARNKYGVLRMRAKAREVLAHARPWSECRPLCERMER